MSEKRLQPKIIFDNIHERNINSVKKLLEVSLPVRYNPQFYSELADAPKSFTKIAYYNDILVGVIGSRLESLDPNVTVLSLHTPKRLHITVLAVLLAYRNRGIGSAIIKHIFDTLDEREDIKEIYLHVWTANVDAISFYEKHGFEKGEEVPNYYARLEPSSSVVMRKKLRD